MRGALKFFGLLVVNVVALLFGTAILETFIGKMFPVRSLFTVLLKEWILSISCAGFIGFRMWHRWRGDAAKWVWIPSALWFGFRFLPAISNGSLWFEFSGTGCTNGIHSVECRNFFVFTIPFVRGVSYSLGAYTSSLVHEGRSSAKSTVPPSTAA